MNVKTEPTNMTRRLVNVLNDHVLGSMEFAVHVVGHRKFGAVKGAPDQARAGLVGGIDDLDTGRVTFFE